MWRSPTFKSAIATVHYWNTVMITREELEVASLGELQLLADLYELGSGPVADLIEALGQLPQIDPGDISLGSGLTDAGLDITSPIRLLLHHIGLPTAAQASIIQVSKSGKLSTDSRLRYSQRRLVLLWEVRETLQNVLALLDQR